MMRRPRVVLTMLLTASFAACSGKAPPRQPTIPVSVAPVKLESIPYLVTTNGIVEPLQTVAVAPQVGSADPRGFDLIINATPMGMKPADPMPIQVERLSPEMFVGDVVTVPEVPPLIEFARSKGCGTMTGKGMFEAVRDRIVEFYLEAAAGRPA